jgi:hypothetical protein
MEIVAVLPSVGYWSFFFPILTHVVQAWEKGIIGRAGDRDSHHTVKSSLENLRTRPAKWSGAALHEACLRSWCPLIVSHFSYPLVEIAGRTRQFLFFFIPPRNRGLITLDKEITIRVG